VFRPEMNGQKVPHDIYVHIAGIDIVRVDADTFYVLEDNTRTPSGVSYMLENREIMLRLFPDLFARRGHKCIHLLGCCGIQVCGIRHPEERRFEQNPETRWIAKGCHCHDSPFLSPREAEHRRYPYPCPAKRDIG